MQSSSPFRRATRWPFLVVIAAIVAAAPEPARAQAAPPGEWVAGDDGTPAQDVAIGVNGDTYSDTDPSALTDFRSTLDPHGTWVDDPTYGQIWVPSADEVGPDFAPYVSEGSWAYDEDYVWISNYDWGWVPFHYGRWAWASGRWGWIPGRAYAGAWVAWRVGPEGYGYVGWGPLAPAFGWRAGVAFGLGAAVASRPGPTVFVGQSDLFAPRVGTRLVVGDRMAMVASGTRPYVRAEPIATGHPVAQGVMHGPPPAALGIPAYAVVRVDPGNPNVSRARAFARPSTAGALGGHPPVAHTVRIREGAGAIHGGAVRSAPPPPRAAGGGARGRR
jgi:hypothetical protein